MQLIENIATCVVVLTTITVVGAGSLLAKGPKTKFSRGAAVSTQMPIEQLLILQDAQVVARELAKLKSQ